MELFDTFTLLYGKQIFLGISKHNESSVDIHILLA